MTIHFGVEEDEGRRPRTTMLYLIHEHCNRKAGYFNSTVIKKA